MPRLCCCCCMSRKKHRSFLIHAKPASDTKQLQISSVNKIGVRPVESIRVTTAKGTFTKPATETGHTSKQKTTYGTVRLHLDRTSFSSRRLENPSACRATRSSRIRAKIDRRRTTMANDLEHLWTGSSIEMRPSRRPYTAIRRAGRRVRPATSTRTSVEGPWNMSGLANAPYPGKRPARLVNRRREAEWCSRTFAR